MDTPRKDQGSTEPVNCPVCRKGGIRRFAPDPVTRTLRVAHNDGTVCSIDLPAGTRIPNRLA